MPSLKMFSRFAATIALIGLIAASAVAQGPGRGGPGGGRGMMGMGGGMGGGVTQLLMIKEVREELNLDEDQITELEEMGKAMRESFAGMRRPEPGQEPDRKAMEEAMEKMRKAAMEAEEKLSDILDPKQLERLVGLMIQRDKTGSLNSKIVADKLGITEDQKAKMADLAKESMEKWGEMMRGGFNPEMRDKMRAFREESEAKVMGVLTSEQKEQMESLKGPEFKFPEPQWGQGGPGGGRGGRGNRGQGSGDGQ
jgi:Spy/CpxP family protein refolding chaperone